MIRSALAAAPVVLTITAGTARAAYGSGYHSEPKSDDEQNEVLQDMQAAGLADEFGMPSAWDEGDPLFGS